MLPVGVAAAPDAVALAWLPFVGAATGALAGACALGVARVAQHGFAVAAAFALSIALTGAIHLDGFLDGCDAFFASATPERRLEILKDPRHGTFALAGFAALASVWFAALWSLRADLYPPALALTAAAARLAAVVHARRVPYGRAGASARAFEAKPPLAVLALAALVVCALAAPLGRRGAAAIAVALVAAALCVAWIRPRLGGVLVGDAYGFSIVVAEVAALAAVTVHA